MGNNKVLLAGLAGTISFFILGWVMYGMILMDFMATNSGSATGVNKSDAEMSFLWIIISNIASGYLFAIVLGKYAKVTSVMEGVKVACTIGFLMGASYDTVMFATTNIMNMNAMIVDILVWTVMCGVSGAVIAAVLNMKSKGATS